MASELGQSRVELSVEAQKRLQGYSWPGNIRELRNVLERAVLVGTDRVIESRHLRLEVPEPATGGAEPSRGSLDQVEQRK